MNRLEKWWGEQGREFGDPTALNVGAVVGIGTGVYVAGKILGQAMDVQTTWTRAVLAAGLAAPLAGMLAGIAGTIGAASLRTDCPD
jgi:hypothetical protein